MIYSAVRHCARAFQLGAFPVVVVYLSACIPRAADAQQLHIIADEEKDTIAVDPNGFLFNPHWQGMRGNSPPMIEHACRFRVVTKHLERRSPVVTVRDCLSPFERTRLTLNEAPQTLGIGAECVTGSKTGQVRGHVNWFPVTATGETEFEEFSPGAYDHDVNIDLLTRVPNASTGANTPYTQREYQYQHQRGYHTEFYSQETLERFPTGSAGFWGDLKRSLGDNSASKRLVDKRVAILTGLYGVDGVHGFHAELHPVFVLALLVNSDKGKETWAVMLRNLGSEGDCAYGMIPMVTAPPDSARQVYILDLGPAPGRVPPTLTMRETWSSDPTFMPYARLVRGTGSSEVHLHLILPQPRPQPAKPDFTILGTIDVDWHGVAPLDSGPPCLPDSVIERIRIQHLDPRRFLGRGVNPRRFESWLPNYCHPEINLHYQETADTAAPEKVLTPDDTAPKLLRVPDRPLDLNVQVEEVPRPPILAEASYAWPLLDSVKRCCERAEWGNAQSLSGRRLVIGGSMLRFPIRATYWRQVTPLIGYYVYPHSAQFIGEGLLANVVNYLALLGYRFDIHGDQFFPLHSNDSTIVPAARRGGTTAELSAFIAPNTVRVGIDLTPYTIAHFGGNCLGNLRSCVGLHFQSTWGWGLGLQAQTAGAGDFFIEVQESVRGGGFKTHWVSNFGWLLPAGR